MVASQAELFKQEKSRSDVYRSDIAHLSSNKANLKEQIKLYADKFDQFKDALTRSEAMFAQFEERISTMSSMVEVLETERAQLKSACNKLDVDLLTEFDRKQAAEKEMERTKKFKNSVTVQCRGLQAERTQLLQKLKTLQEQQADMPPLVPPAST
jgi:chromosome segregation ATPase